jgi:hypothetical protein
MLAPTKHDCTATTMSTGHPADIELTEPTASDLQAQQGHLAAEVIDVDPHLGHNGTLGGQAEPSSGYPHDTLASQRRQRPSLKVRYSSIRLARACAQL